jgi:hypothetical protein
VFSEIRITEFGGQLVSTIQAALAIYSHAWYWGLARRSGVHFEEFNTYIYDRDENW